MAGTTVARRETAAAGGTVRQMRVELNKLITDVELLRVDLGVFVLHAVQLAMWMALPAMLVAAGLPLVLKGSLC